MKRRSFVIGRRTSRGTMIVLLSHFRAPILGPWTLQAVVSQN